MIKLIIKSNSSPSLGRITPFVPEMEILRRDYYLKMILQRVKVAWSYFKTFKKKCFEFYLRLHRPCWERVMFKEYIKDLSRFKGRCIYLVKIRVIYMSITLGGLHIYFRRRVDFTNMIHFQNVSFSSMYTFSLYLIRFRLVHHWFLFSAAHQFLT